MEDFEIISADEVERTPRGRKPNPETLKLAQALGNVKPGQAIRIQSMAVNVKDQNVKAEKARIGSAIRTAAAMANQNVKIHWSATGIPQVVVTK